MNIFELAKTAKEIANKWVEAELINELYRGNFEQGFVLGHNQLPDGLFELQNNSYATSQFCSAEAYATQLGYLAGQEFRKSDRTQNP